MRARTTLLSAIAFLSVFASANAQTIDSAQWPFPDTLKLSCALGGNYTFVYKGIAPDGTGRMIDSTWTNNEFLTVPAYATSDILFTWKDVKSIDSLGWHLGNQSSSMTVTFDSSNHDITHLDFNYNSLNGSATGENLSYTLYQLHYDQSNITCSDNDLWRHIRFGTYKMILGFTGDLTTVTFAGIDGFNFYGMHLIPGFSFPSTIDFGSQSVDSVRDTTIVLQNLSDTALTIYSYELQNSDSGFSFIDTTTHFIAPQDSGKITVRFTPHETKMYSCNVHIVTDEPYAPTYSIQLAGTAASSSVTLATPALTTLNVIPSVADAYINVQLPSDDGALSICNILGQRTYSNYATTGLIGNISSIDTHSWPNGSYMASFTNKQGSAAAKFVVRH